MIAFSRRYDSSRRRRRLPRRPATHAFFYGNFDRDQTAWTTYPAEPRFGTTYVGLRNRLSILSEAYAYAPFEDRVRGTLAFVAAVPGVRGRRTRRRSPTLLDRARAETVGRDRRRRADPLGGQGRSTRPATILGFEESAGAGPRRASSAGVPKDYEVTLVQRFEPTRTVARPFAYVIPPGFAEAVETLAGTGSRSRRVREDVGASTPRSIGSTRSSSAAAATPARRRSRSRRRRGPSRSGSRPARARPDGAAAREPGDLPPGARVGRRPRDLGVARTAVEAGADFPVVRLVEPLSS